MLSDGQWHKRVPREARANLRRRREVIAKASGDEAGQRAIVEACRKDVLFWINLFVYQYNPRKKGDEIGPFITWGFQEDACRMILACIENDEDLVIEKSREMGASWLCLIVMLWLWLFHPWKKFLAISRNEKAVEDEDPDSLFWKIDFMLRYLPGWMLPGKGNLVKRRKLYYGNEENGSTITGQASTGQAGVGGRATAMFIDEFSQIKEDYEVLQRTSDTTGCRIFNGTHLGLDTAFYELTNRVDIKKLQMHWTQHPDKVAGLYQMAGGKVEVIDKQYDYPEEFKFVMDGSPVGGPFPGMRSPWYDEQCKRKGSSRAVAMDLDINPTGSVSQFFEPLVIRDLIVATCLPPYWQGEVLVDPDTFRVKELARREGGPLKLWCNLDNANRPRASRYAGGADVARGVGATPSCLSLLDASLGEKVLEYTSDWIDPNQFAELAAALCWLFAAADGTPASLAWEMQGPGKEFGLRIIKIGFRNIYYRTNELKPFNREPNDTPGWYPTDDAKMLVLAEYRTALRTGQFINRSEDALKETLLFKYSDNGRKVFHPGEVNDQDPSRAGVNHGDHVIADALAWKMAKGKEQKIGPKQEEEAQEGSLAWRRIMRQSNERQLASVWR